MHDGLVLGAGDAVIGINPVGDSVSAIVRLLHLLDGSNQRQRMPTQSCVTGGAR